MALDPRAEVLLVRYRLAGLVPPDEVVAAAMAAAKRRREREASMSPMGDIPPASTTVDMSPDGDTGAPTD